MENEKSRPSWDEYYMTIAVITASRSSCLKFHTGAIIVKDNRIVSTGYNGNPTGVISCYEQGFCNKEKANVNLLVKGSGHCLAAHGETNAILHAGMNRAKGAKMYSLLFPCNECAKLIINSGIKELIYLFNYKEEVPKAEEMLKAAGVKFRKIELSQKKINEMVERVYTQKSLNL